MMCKLFGHVEPEFAAICKDFPGDLRCIRCKDVIIRGETLQQPYSRFILP